MYSVQCSGTGLLVHGAAFPSQGKGVIPSHETLFHATHFVAELLKKCWHFSYILVLLLQTPLFHTPHFSWWKPLAFIKSVLLPALLPNFVKEKREKNLIRNKIMNNKRLSLELYFFNIKSIFVLHMRFSWIFCLSHTGVFFCTSSSHATGSVSTVTVCGWSASAGVSSGEGIFFSFCISCSNWALTSLTQKPQVSVSPELRQNDFLHRIHCLLTNLLFHNLSFSSTWPCYLSLTHGLGRGQRLPVSVMQPFLLGVYRVQGHFRQMNGALVPAIGASLCHQWEAL